MRDFRLVFLFAFGLLLFIATPFAASAQTTSDRIACVCGTVTAYTAAVPGTPGSLTIGGQTFAIADTTTIANADLIVVGTDVCLSATRDTTGALIGPATVIASTGGEPLSRPPLLSIPSTVTATQGSALTFTVAGTDALGGATSLTACGLPENATFDATTGQFSFTPAANQANQSFNVTFTVETCFGGSVSQSVTINVGPTSTQGAPFFNTPSGPITFNPGAATNFNVTASSPTAGCAVTVTASGLPEGATFDAATGAFSFTPTDAQLGQSFSAVFTATDCNNVTSTFALPIFVTAADGSTPGAICSPVKKIQFNNTKVGTSCGTVTITVFNTGGQALNINTVSLATGTNFRIVGTSANGTSLGAGGQTSITVAFVPTAKGTLSDTLTIASSDATQPSIAIKLTGKGTK